MSGLKLTVSPLTPDGFAPFGDVIETQGRAHYPMNAGTAQRYDDLAKVDVGAQGGRPLVSICRAQPVKPPLMLRLMERHPLSSQAFIPLSETPFLVVVAPPGEGIRSEDIRAFRSNGRQGINYRAGTWHHPLLALDRVSDFLIIDRGGEGANCDEIPIADRDIAVEL
ncbi:MAG: ureidoglycolate lyase [Rhodospirillaceae bacterium]|jgi:ureidoglycolate lyase|nr:ureidoglycolate lyase [Rhodospirillaceae bacterium]